jgi:hypothetical protein
VPQPRGDRNAKLGSGRAFRGLLLVFFLSFFNLIGVIFTLTAFGGLAPWSRWQFIGAFGVLETASCFTSARTRTRRAPG